MRKQIWQRGSTSVSICFHNGQIFNHTLCNPKTTPSSIYQNVQEETLARTVEGKEKLEQIEPVRFCIPENGGGGGSLRGRQ